MALSTVDYRTTVLEYSTLTCIHGEPTFEGVRKLHKEVMVNAQTVHPDLVYGAHSHLGLVLSPQRYALISNTNYNRPQHPGQLVIPVGTSQHIARTMKEQHVECLRVFQEVIGVDGMSGHHNKTTKNYFSTNNKRQSSNLPTASCQAFAMKNIGHIAVSLDLLCVLLDHVESHVLSIFLLEVQVSNHVWSTSTCKHPHILYTHQLN